MDLKGGMFLSAAPAPAGSALLVQAGVSCGKTVSCGAVCLKRA